MNPYTRTLAKKLGDVTADTRRHARVVSGNGGTVKLWIEPDGTSPGGYSPMLEEVPRALAELYELCAKLPLGALAEVVALIKSKSITEPQWRFPDGEVSWHLTRTNEQPITFGSLAPSLVYGALAGYAAQAMAQKLRRYHVGGRLVGSRVKGGKTVAVRGGKYHDKLVKYGSERKAAAALRMPRSTFRSKLLRERGR